MSIDFVAVDFETANSFRGSPCAIGLVKVKGGQIVDEHSSFIRPPDANGPEDFDDFNIAIHGIKWTDVANAPRLADVWAANAVFFDNLPLVAHNSAFDMSVIRETFALEEYAWPEFKYACSLVLARRFLTLPSFSLPFVALDLGVETGRHHDALDDARTCASIILALSKTNGVTSFNELMALGRVSWGVMNPSHWTGSTKKARLRGELPPPREAASKDHFLYGQKVVMTGALPGGITRQEAQQRLAFFGGTPQENVTAETTILIVGDIPIHLLAPGAEISGKMKRAFDLQKKGQRIEVMSGMDFVALLS
jgi:DNA polymerase-3 subunit epsilon